jgi:hypothetical protein
MERLIKASIDEPTRASAFTLSASGSAYFLLEVEAPKNMPLPLPLCFKDAVRILVDFC